MDTVKFNETLETLRPYQKEGLEIMSTSGRWLECDDMGLGKTVTTLTSFMSKVDLTGQRALILCGTIAMGVWQHELQKWFNEKSVIYAGTPAKRKKIWEEFEKDEDTHFLITTYAMLKELPRGWAGVFADERASWAEFPLYHAASNFVKM